jgi:YD repeat-containing protein
MGSCLLPISITWASTFRKNIYFLKSSDYVNFLISIQHAMVQRCPIGALCAATNERVKTDFQYDDWGNITKQTQKIDGQSAITQHSYDSGNRIVGLTYPNGERIAYQRDELGRVLETTQNGRLVVSNRTYRADGRFKEQTLGNSTIEARQYNEFTADLGLDHLIFHTA